MSWTANVPSTPRANINAAIDSVVSSPSPLDMPQRQHFIAAKAAAKIVAASVEGPNLSVDLGGHARTPDDPPFQGTFISVVVHQVMP